MSFTNASYGCYRYIATTHFEPTGARRAFPCWDEPEYKAIFNIKITHPTTHTAISNMPQASTDDTTNNTKITTFKPTKKMSTYLVAFVVSDYDKKQNSDGTFRVWTKPHAVDQTQYAFDVGQDVLKKLKEYTGIDYYTYMEKMDQISIKDFTAGAMENWGLVTYRYIINEVVHFSLNPFVCILTYFVAEGYRYRERPLGLWSFSMHS